MSYKISHQGTTDKPLSAEESNKVRDKKLEKGKFCPKTGVGIVKNTLLAEEVSNKAAVKEKKTVSSKKSKTKKGKK